MSQSGPAEMRDFKEMQRRWAQRGKVVWIGHRPKKFAPMQSVDRAVISENGLDGDRARAGKRAITLIQAEHLEVIGAFLGRDAISPDILRRNIVVAGLNLSALRGRKLRIGSAEVDITVPCAPCSRMEAALGPGGYSALRGHGGWCASVTVPGAFEIGAPVVPSD